LTFTILDASGTADSLTSDGDERNTLGGVVQCPYSPDGGMADAQVVAVPD